MPTNQFQDSWDRIESAYKEYDEFLVEVDKTMHLQMQRMISSSPDDPNRTTIRLLTPKELIELTNRPRVLVGQISENLRSALDYIIFRLSERNDPNMNNRLPAFVMADDSTSFHRASGTALKYLTPDQERIVEGLQPYHGHDYMQLIRDASNRSKHRGLLTLRNFTGTEIILDSTANAADYQGAWQFPQPNGQTVYVERKDRNVVFLEEYDAVLCLKYMLEGARAVVWAFERYLFTGKFPTIDTTRKYSGKPEDYAVTASIGDT